MVKMVKEDNYKKRIESLINDLKNSIRITIKTQHNNNKELLEDLKLYVANDLKDEDKVYIDVLYKLANRKNTKDCVFSLNSITTKANAAYVVLLERIIKAYKVDKKEAIKIAINSQTDRNKFTDAYDKFNNYYVNASLYKYILDDVLKAVNENNKPNEEKRNTYINKKAMTLSIDNIYNDIYRSGLSLLDYAHTHFIDSKKHKNFFRPDLLNIESALANALLDRKDTCLDELINIINMINNGELEDGIEYYKLTKLNPATLKNIAKDYNLNTVTLSKFVSNNANPQNEEYKINTIIEGKLVIAEEEVSEELKLQAKQYMIDLDMPLSIKYYSNIVRKLIKSK